MKPKHTKSLSRISLILIFALIFMLTHSALSATGTINFNVTYQELEGFGGAGVFDAYQLLSHDEAEEIYDLLFRDLGLDIYRIQNPYSHNTHYNYIYNTSLIVEAAKDAGRNPDLKILMTPWSPPESLKSNNSLNGGTLDGGPDSYVYADYADWWYASLTEVVADPWDAGNYIGSWANVGIAPDYISLQNEPDLAGAYESCKFLPTETADFAGYDQALAAVYTKLNAEMGGDMPKIIGPDTMGITAGSTPLAGPYLDAIETLGVMDNLYGFSSHIYSDSLGDYTQPDEAGRITAYQDFKTNYGDEYDKPIFQTEYSATDTTAFSNAPLMARHIHNCLVEGNVSAYFYWSLFRDNNNEAMINLTSTTEYDVHDVYYWFKHYAYFTDPGWFRIGADVAGTGSANLRVTAFKSPDGDHLTIVAVNISASNVVLNLTINGYDYDDAEVYRSSETEQWVDIGPFNPNMTLPGNSITTIALVANLPRFTLTTSSAGNGSVTTPGEGEYQYVEETYASITATPARYYHFLEWTGTAVDASKVDDPSAATTTVLMDNDYTVIANFELDNFGFVNGRNNKIVVNDCADVPVTFSLTGDDYGVLAEDCDFSTLVLHGTDERSALTIRPIGRGVKTEIGDIVVNGPIGRIMARNVDINGDITIDGSLKSMEFTNNTGENTITIGPTANPRDAANIKFDQASDLAIVSQMPIRTLTATEWADPENAFASEITAPSMASLQIRGDRRRAIAGDFNASLHLTGGSTEPTLRNARIIGALQNDIIVDGDVGTLMIKQLRGNVQINGSARNIRITDSLALVRDDDPEMGEIEIAGAATITGFRARARCTNGCSFFGRSSAMLYSCEDLSLYDTLGASWEYSSQYTSRSSAGADSGTEEVTIAVEDVSGDEYEISMSAAGIVDTSFGFAKDGDATSLEFWDIFIGDDDFTIDIADIFVAPEKMQIRQNYRSRGTFTGNFENLAEGLAGDMQGTATMSNRLLGHEEVTTGLATYMTAKIQQSLILRGTISNIEYEGTFYTIRFQARIDMISWSDADAGYVKYQIRNLRISYRLPGAATENITIRAISELTNANIPLP